MSTPASAVVDITGRVPISGTHRIAVWVFPPKAPVGAVPVLFCLPGGSYTKAYWHFEVPGRSGYSFAEHMAAQGMLVIAVDHIGVGDSSRHPRAIELTPDVVSKANAVALADLLARAAAGTLIPGFDALKIGPVVGVGHSMGAMLAIFQQSLHGGFDAIAPLGYGVAESFADYIFGGDRSKVPSYESVMAHARTGAWDEPFMGDRGSTALRRHFYWEDVPEDVIAADVLTNGHLPGVTGPLSIVPFIATDHAGRVRCPVFIGLGERDSTARAHDEPRAYGSSNDVTLFVLPKSGHCQNSAGTRHMFWDRIARWVKGLAAHGTT